MDANAIRKKFFEFFEENGHKIVASAPIVNKNDPTLLFTNAGMNQFKDYFLGNQEPPSKRIADTQKCLRVSGKHNDLEEVGLDSYHHTMFEMLGNWSFGDYFKMEAIAWAWELLTEEFGLSKDRLYATVFEGDKGDGLDADHEAANHWKNHLPEDRILFFDKKDNFWEMGDTGPCGPCSEIHIDLRSDKERKEINGVDLVNKDHPLVVEIWNLVFIQFNRKSNGSLEELPEKHVDTGMGFERLCMAVQGKLSNYDTDLFGPFIDLLEELTGLKYTGSYRIEDKKDTAFRVLVDHLRAVSFAIADGQLPSNTGAGYVIRRILRRAVRYYFSFMDRKEPLLHLMVPLLSDRFGAVFPEIAEQKKFISKIINEEEKGFLRTLEGGLKKIEQLGLTHDQVLDGRIAFELYDTYGFPIDLTTLISQEKGWSVDIDGFNVALEEQKARSRADAHRESGDWEVLRESDDVQFVGYDQINLEKAHIIKQRKTRVKGREVYHLVLDKTPFYAESGGQVGDQGVLKAGDESILVLDTQKENDLIIHIVNKLPADPTTDIRARVDEVKRRLTENNHSATHLVHAALRKVLGDHVQQRGSLVNHKYLRFDFSHFEKMTDDQIKEVERVVNEKIRENIQRGEARNVPMEKARESGAMMLFGEKYGDFVRMITFDPDFSVELCGGCHVDATGNIGLFKIKSESGIAAGIRRIEALTSIEAEDYVNGQLEELQEIRHLLKSPQNVVTQVSELIESQKTLEKELSQLKSQQIQGLKEKLIDQTKEVNDIKLVTAIVDDIDMPGLKSLAISIEQSVGTCAVLFGVRQGEKAGMMLYISRDLTDRFNAGTIIRQISKYIQGGGGGQPFYATAGGKNVAGLDEAIREFENIISS